MIQSFHYYFMSGALSGVGALVVAASQIGCRCPGGQCLTWEWRLRSPTAASTRAPFSGACEMVLHACFHAWLLPCLRPVDAINIGRPAPPPPLGASSAHTGVEVNTRFHNSHPGLSSTVQRQRGREDHYTRVPHSRLVVVGPLGHYSLKPASHYSLE